MGKKGGKTGTKGKEKAGDGFTFLGTTFGPVKRDTVKRHLAILVLVSLAVKGLVLFATTAVFSSFIDLFDLGFYLQNAQLVLQGQVPYIGFAFDYPPLIWLPIGIALVPALLLQSGMAFVWSFQLLMVLCDLGTLLCVYFIALKVRGEQAAWHAGLLYATAFSAAYFVLTKYDAFPTLLLMAAILFTLYGRTLSGYASATAGFFAKIFPAVSLPFLVLYNARATSLRQEILSALKVILPFVVVFMLPLLFLKPSALATYLFATGSGLAVYVNTATYTLYAFLHEVLRIGVTADQVSLAMYAGMAVSFLVLLRAAFRGKEQRPGGLLALILLAVFTLVFFSKFHSPQYIVWYTPLLCILVTREPVKLVLFYLTQAFGYLEFPLLFGTAYVNLEYLSPAGSAGYYLTLAFFVLEYLALLSLVCLCVRPKEGVRAWLRGLVPRA